MRQPRARRQVSRLPPERRIADIMAAAREVFTEKGYSESLIAEIAERAGVVEGTIYRFFTNKHELLLRVAEEWYDELLSRDAVDFLAVTGEWNRLHYLIHRHLLSLKRDPGLSRLVFQELRPDPRYRSTRLFALNRDYTRRVMLVVQDGITNGTFRADISPILVRDMVFGAVEHRAWAFLRGEGDFDPDDFARALTDMIWHGLVAPTGGQQPRDHLLARLEIITARLDDAARRLEGRGDS